MFVCVSLFDICLFLIVTGERDNYSKNVLHGTWLGWIVCDFNMRIYFVVVAMPSWHFHFIFILVLVFFIGLNWFIFGNQIIKKPTDTHTNEHFHNCKKKVDERKQYIFFVSMLHAIEWDKKVCVWILNWHFKINSFSVLIGIFTFLFQS